MLKTEMFCIFQSEHTKLIHIKRQKIQNNINMFVFLPFCGNIK